MRENWEEGALQEHLFTACRINVEYRIIDGLHFVGDPWVNPPDRHLKWW
jgi:hypothetical protein